MMRLMTGRCGYSGAVLVTKLLPLGYEIVTGHQPGGLNDQNRWPNLRWMQKAIPQ